MKVEIVANGTVSFALIPENDMDRAAMKMLLKQSNEFVEITKQTQILNKASFTEGIVIQPKARETSGKEECATPTSQSLDDLRDGKVNLTDLSTGVKIGEIDLSHQYEAKTYSNPKVS